jgi:hypothetical protein
MLSFDTTCGLIDPVPAAFAMVESNHGADVAMMGRERTVSTGFKANGAASRTSLAERYPYDWIAKERGDHVPGFKMGVGFNKWFAEHDNQW